MVDRGRLVAYDRATGAWLGEVALDGSVPNDVCAGPRGELYVTDTGLNADLTPSGTDAVYRIGGSEAAVYAAGTHLNLPNGCATLGANVVVTSYDASGEVYRLNASGEKHLIATLPAGQIDGVQRVGGSWYVTSWLGSGVFRLPLGGGEAVRVLDLATPADPGYDPLRGNLLVPGLFGHVLVIAPVP